MVSENVMMGKKIRKRRGDFDLSLRELANKTSLTASFLSQVERGVISPSLNSLRKIAEALEVPLLFFLSDTSDRSPLVRANARPHIDLEHSSVTYELLTPDMSRKMEVICGTLEFLLGKRRAPFVDPNRGSHPGTFRVLTRRLGRRNVHSQSRRYDLL